MDMIFESGDMPLAMPSLSSRFSEALISISSFMKQEALIYNNKSLRTYPLNMCGHLYVSLGVSYEYTQREVVL